MCLLACVGLEQAVHGVLLVARGLDEARAGQGVECAGRQFRHDAGQGGNRVRVEVGTGVQAG